VRNVLAPFEKGKMVNLYLTEIGWPNHDAPGGATRGVSAEFLARTYLLAQSKPFVRGLWWYDWRDDGMLQTNCEYNYGIVAHDLTPKPAYFAMRDICTGLAGARFSDEVTMNPEVRVLRFVKAPGTTVFAMWSLVETHRFKVLLQCTQDAAPTRLRVVGMGEIALPWEKMGAEAWQLSMTLDTMPFLIETEARNVKLICEKLP